MFHLESIGKQSCRWFIMHGRSVSAGLWGDFLHAWRLWNIIPSSSGLAFFVFLAGYLGRSEVLTWVLVMFSETLPSWSGWAPNTTSLTPAEHPRLRKRICSSRAGEVRAEETVKERSTLDAALKRESDKDEEYKMENDSTRIKEGKDWNPTVRRRVVLFYKGERHGRDNVRTTVMCHHSQPVISTLAGEGGGRWWARAHPTTDRTIARRPILSAKQAIAIQSRLHSDVPDYPRYGCWRRASTIRALW